ncbi:peptidase M4 [Xenorhabdus beddingii]|uniref:Peptidase M4 n=1 Tax=Xenorhabdus beddingii TaxID=40578 RepID=A0A1Y2SKT4_9GAMM|nr:protealysin propeptide domain-containing protein [Xenorhabdus beddingii]OTA19349.1 peptidase M4 [Xenorhabdus beddingii]
MSNNKIEKQNIIPPYLLESIAKNCDSDDDKECILKTLNHVNQLMKNQLMKNQLMKNTPRENQPCSNKDN